MQLILNLAKWPKRLLSTFFPTSASGLGAFSGVYVPSVLMMLGVIVYLRLGWVAGNVGSGAMASIITLSLIIMIITSFSMTSIVSNMKVGGGGAYYMISRSLGIEIGSAIGIALFLCQCVSASLCVSGFAESIHSLAPHISIKAVELSALTLLALVSFISTNLALSTQFLIFVVLGASLFSIFTGSGANIPIPTEHTPALIGFWGAFAMFYPAMTGVEVGMAMSGTLKKPSRDLPIGIIASLLTVYVIYLALSLFMTHVATPEQLRSDTFIAYKIASIPQLILLGIWGATLSSTMSCLIGAPRMLQAIAEDGVLPSFFAKTYGKRSEPRVAITITFLIALVINLTTTIDQIIPLIAMICLISYGSLNFVVYLEEILKNPSWRPNFRIPWIVPLVGGIACLGTMWMINPLMTIVGFAVVIAIYLWVSLKNIQGDWQDIRYSLLFYIYRKVAYRLARTTVQARNWRPNILTIAGSPLSKENLIYFSHSLTQGKGYLVFASIIPDYFHDDFSLEASQKVFEDYLEKKRIPSLVEVCSLQKGYAGVRELVKAYSFGVLQPNTVIITAPGKEDSILEFSRTIEEIYHTEKNVLIFRDQAENLFSEKQDEAKTIDIWWEGNNRYNLDLTLSLYSVLRNAPRWKNLEATVKMVVDSEQTKESLEEYFDGFLKRNRIDIDVHIYVLPDTKEPLNMVEYFSQSTDLVFLGLRPFEDGETPEQYSSYYEDLERKTASLKNVIYVLHGENLNHREMWKFD